MSKSELTIARHITAPPSAVWDAWSDPAKLAQWWIPAPIECRVDKLDLCPGGGFVTRMREGDGDFGPHVDGCFLEAVPNERLVFTTVLTEGWQPVDPWLALTAILTFEAKDGGTLYSARVLHKTPEDSAKHEEMGFYEGWRTAIGQLAAMLER
ncbi:SRPBCC domain-containing protein [Sphingopyxis sp.]|uniref:SRPBCC domain-containing protein n=1 Tax=Sphingopyxis sp. TaxID=1908224 RepID=UPI002D799E16|nr:SRPBCC domain-containing protein [Sphingopyxis sp.]HET6523845.1 SRPBCC domain-containing protein [Sphingopyxis sp.]